MGYRVYLENLLRPMGVYDLETGGGAGELYALGNALDGIFAAVTAAERECVVPTAQTVGLSSYEEVLPGIGSAGTESERRARIMALLQTDDMSFSREKLDRTLAACGAGMSVHETGTPFTAAVRMPTAVRGIVEPDERWMRRVAAVLPCHLAITLEYNFPTWDQIEAAYAVWNDFGGVTVAELEVYCPEQ